MDKKEYYSFSAKQKLPNRCPILNYCARRLITIYFFGFHDTSNGQDYVTFLKEKGIISQEDIERLINIKGEVPSFTPGRTMIAYDNLCPEVNLFDSEFGFRHARGTASVSGEWDELRNSKEKFKNYEYRHFSECPEFNTVTFDFKKTYTKAKTERTRIGLSKQLRFEVLQRDNYKCVYCGKGKEDGVKLHIDHIIPIDAGGKDEFKNLVTSCQDCNLGKSNKIV